MDAPISLYWLEDTLRGLPSATLIYAMLGIPWALLLLPRAWWSERAILGALAFAAGPALATAWMLILGVAGAAQGAPLLRPELILGGVFMLTLAGVVLAWRKARQPYASSPHATAPLDRLEWLLILTIGAALIVRWIVTAYWPFFDYDSLWVYGYQGRLYTLIGYIPNDIGYYPQFVPLQYAFQQILHGGINDHAARAVIPFMHLGSVLSAYTLGRLLFTRRTGIFVAAIWALYPHVGDWARTGDLEIPLAFLFTLSAAFFLRAWMSSEASERHPMALLAGFVFGIAMWTKPTAGAFVWGVALLVALDLILKRFNWRAWWPRLEAAILTGLACIPLGAVWYLRNIALGHPPLVFPHPSWLDLARQSGDLFGWPLLLLVLLLIWSYTQTSKRPALYLILPGLMLLSLALLPSMPWLNPVRYDPPESRLQPTEWLALLVGILLIALAFWRWQKQHHAARYAAVPAWGLLLALPYFLTWFFSYSYHARLSFAIVPLLILPSAALLTRWFSLEHLQRWRSAQRALLLATVALITIPGIFVAWYDAARDKDWLWTNRYPDDDARYRLYEPSLLMVVDALKAYAEETGRTPVVVAPGEQRLPFFFPLMQIDTRSLPTRLDELAGATHYIYGAFARWRYADESIAPETNQVVSALGRGEIMTQVLRHTDATFRYELYELHLDERFNPVRPTAPHETPTLVRFGDAIRYRADGVAGDNFRAGTVFIDILWQVEGSVDRDYQVAIWLVHEASNEVVARWQGPVAPGEHGYYGTQVWQPGEFILSTHKLALEEGQQKPIAAMEPGPLYRLEVGFVDASSGEFLPVTIDGDAVGERYRLPGVFLVGRAR